MKKTTMLSRNSSSVISGYTWSELAKDAHAHELELTYLLEHIGEHVIAGTLFFVL